MPTAADITTFPDGGSPPGASPWVRGTPSPALAVVDPDPGWPQRFLELTALVEGALGARVLTLDHIGSTSVPGLAAKPVVDIDLVLADPADESAYVPALERAGFELWVREPWWDEHRMLRHSDPRCHLHVFGPDSAAPFRDRLFRDHLRRSPEDRDLYAGAKREASQAALAAGEHGMQYNARKQDVVREIFSRAFVAAGLRSG